MQFSTLQSEVFSQTGLVSTDSGSQTLVKRWLNITQQDIVGRWPWTFLRSEENITTVPDYSTGTVSVSSGGTAVTGTNTVFASGVGDGTYKIQFQGALDWYTVSARGGATSLTISTAYAPTTNLTSGTYTLRRFYYPLSSTCDRILDVKNNNTPLKTFETDMRTLDSVNPDLQAANNTYSYVAWTVNTDSTSAYYGNIMIQPYPFPSDSRLLWIKKLIRVSDMSADTDVSVIPAKWHHILIFGACALAWIYKKDLEVATAWRVEYEKKIEDMMLQGKLSEDEAPVLKSIDSVARGEFIQLPGNFPIIRGGR